MMWGKTEQTILWVVTYIPLMLIMILRYVISNYFSDVSNYQIVITDHIITINFIIIEVFLVLVILLLSFTLYKLTIKYLLAGYEETLKPGSIGKNISIREIKYLNVNDYSFFLLTLLLPLVSLDHSSTINLVISLAVILYIITIYVKTDSISSCPLFFFSGRKVYKGIISEGTKEEELKNPSLRKEVVIVLKEENLNLNGKMRGEKLVNNVFYLTSKE